MESLGEKLKTKRQEIGISIEQVARDTNIAKRYIEALEAEDFSVFPGEPYVIGFLRTYAENLGLVSDEIIALYKNIKIQEQPLPMNELLDEKRRNPLLIIIIILAAAGLGAGGYFGIPKIREYMAQREPRVKEEEASASATGVTYNMTDEILERRFYEGDEILISINNQDYPILLAEVGKNLTVVTPLGEEEFGLSEENLIDLDGDGKGDLKVFVRDLDSESEKRSVIVRFDKFTQARISQDLMESGEEESAEYILGDEGEIASLPAMGSTNVPDRSQRTVSLIEADSPQQISIDFVFRGYCLFRYLSDKQNREERYFHKGETFRLEAQREVMLWVSNAGSFKARLGNKDIEIGRPGEVAAKLIKWVEDEQSGAYKLQIIPIY